MKHKDSNGKYIITFFLVINIIFGLTSFAQSPPFFSDSLDYTTCINCNINNTNNYSCPNQSALYNDYSFFMINPNSVVKTIRLNFIFVQKDDGSGNFQENDQDHQAIINDIIAKMNFKMANFDVSACGGINSHSKIQFDVNKIYIQDTYLWNNDNDGGTYKCPNVQIEMIGI